jgi:hypothetical protein
MGMFVLDRVLDRDDVAAVAGVDRVDQRGERRALARAGGTADQDEAARKTGQQLHRGGQPQLGEIGRMRRQGADRRRRTPTLPVQVDTEPTPAGEPP